jgi:SNF2 family DNA or RNA helicase
VLTGTPLENKLEELYSVVEFVDGRRLGLAFRFLKEHRVEDEGGTLLGYREQVSSRLKARKPQCFPEAIDVSASIAVKNCFI